MLNLLRIEWGLHDFFGPIRQYAPTLAPSCPLPDGPAVKQVARCIDEASAKIGACRKHIAGCAEEKDSEHDSLPFSKSRVKADGQLAGSPSVIFDAVALIVSEEGCNNLLDDAAALDFTKDAFGHLKAIGCSSQARPLLEKAGVFVDGGIVALSEDSAAFVEAARTRQWDREAQVRSLA